MTDRYVRSGAGGSANGTSWANAYLTLAAAIAGSAAGDNFYVSEDHAESTASALVLTFLGTTGTPQNRAYCVNHAGSVPPVSADLRTTGSVSTTGASSITLDGPVIINGLIFNAGSAANAANIILTSAGGSALRLLNCALVLNNTATTSRITFGNTNNSDYVSLFNTTMQFGSVSQGITQNGGCAFTWKNTPTALAGATFPTVLFLFAANTCVHVPTIEGVDLSALGSNTLSSANSIFFLKDCKLGSGAVLQDTSGTHFFQSSQYCPTMIRCDSGGTAYRTEKGARGGYLSTESVAVRTGGASDGVTPISWKMVTTALSLWEFPFESIPIAKFNNTTGANVNVTIEGLINAAALPNNDDLWFDIEYLGSASSPLGSFKSGSKADGLGTTSNAALTASTQAWDSKATARANTHAYSVGDMISLASNPGRLFFCTSAGTSAGSEPGGYASAVDGGSVTDSGATFRAAVRFKSTVTLTSPQPGLIGYLTAIVKAAKASTTYYVDPVMTLS